MLTLLFAILAHAADLKCTAPFDDSSYYQLVAKTESAKIIGPVGFSYVTTDGLDLRAQLKLSEQKMIPGKMFSFSGSNGNMSVKAGADFVPEDKNYQGAMEVSFSYDGTPPVAVAMSCTLNETAN
ncbi:MAG: hypothetical protein ACXWQO_04770 [Bdellovibrionota bacterium]